MPSRLWGWILSRVPSREPVEIEIPPDDGEALDGIRTSLQSFQDAHDRRPKIEGVVDALAAYKRANHFGEKLDHVFMARE